MRGDSAQIIRRRELLADLDFLPTSESAVALASRLIVPGGFPAKAAADALHVSIATVYACEYLLTWNMRHTAKATIRRFSERMIAHYGYEATTICTPKEFLGVDGFGTQ